MRFSGLNWCWLIYLAKRQFQRWQRTEKILDSAKDSSVNETWSDLRWLSASQRVSVTASFSKRSKWCRVISVFGSAISQLDRDGSSSFWNFLSSNYYVLLNISQQNTECYPERKSEVEILVDPCPYLHAPRTFGSSCKRIAVRVCFWACKEQEKILFWGNENGLVPNNTKTLCRNGQRKTANEHCVNVQCIRTRLYAKLTSTAPHCRTTNLPTLAASLERFQICEHLQTLQSWEEIGRGKNVTNCSQAFNCDQETLLSRRKPNQTILKIHHHKERQSGSWWPPNVNSPCFSHRGIRLKKPKL